MYDSSGSHSIGVVIRHLILPAAAIAIPEIGKVMRHVRSNMLEVMNEDYVRTARAKGVRESAVVIVHAFRNTLIPIVTVLSGSIPFMIGGSVVVEKGIDPLRTVTIGISVFRKACTITTALSLTPFALAVLT